MKKTINALSGTLAALSFLASMVGVFVALFACGEGDTWNGDLYNSALIFAMVSIMGVCLPSGILHASTL